jgi:hypothetical protein
MALSGRQVVAEVDAGDGTCPDVTATEGRLAVRFVPAEGYTFTDAFTIESNTVHIAAPP